MGNRRQPRIPLRLRVTVSGVDKEGNPFVQTAYARDVSSAGARLDGLDLLKSSGQTVNVEYNGRSEKFQVVWVGEPGRHEQGHVGIRSLEPNRDFWQREFPRTGADNYRAPHAGIEESSPVAPASAAAQPAKTQSGERRRRPRQPGVGVNVEFCAPGASVGMSGRLSDISLAGCYIEVLTPCLQGTALDVVLRHQGSDIRLPGRVVTVHPGMGMGIEFDQTAAQSSTRLAGLVGALGDRKVR
jgi:PilZ domain